MLKLADLLEERAADLQMQLGVYTDEKAPIYIVASAAEYQRMSLGKATIVEFSDAFYNGKEGKIYIRSGDQVQDNYLNILMHEYIHWYLEQVFIAAPLWFHEGMATYYGGQLGYERYLEYLRATFWGKSGNLFRMSYTYPTDQADWGHFYISSAMALRYMETKHPQQWEHFWSLVAGVHREGKKIRFNQAFLQSYGQSLFEFNAGFERHSKRQGYLYLALALNSLIFLCLPFVMLIIARKRRKKMAQLPDLELVEEESEDER